MELSVVIVNYRVKYLLEQTLRSVEQAMQGMDGEVIVVDNLTLMKTDFAVSSLEYAIMANMYLLKMIAKKQKVPVLFFSEDDNIIANDTYLDKFVSFNMINEPIKNLKFC